jgi:ABC-type oligopeptide transport system substrate-binding subunit
MDLEPDPYYYGPKPRIRIHAPSFPTSDAEFKAYQAGELDGATLPSADLPAAQHMKGFIDAPQFVTDYMLPNAQIPPFNNLHCRLAVAYGVDRENITRKLLRGTETPLYDMLPPGILGYFRREPDVPSYNPVRAKKELDQCSGHLQNVGLTVQNANGDIVHEYDAIRANLQAIGASVTVKPLNFDAWVKVVTQNLNATKDQERITEAEWFDDYPDPQDWCTNLMHSGSSYNVNGFKSARYDSLVDRADVQPNPARRASLYEAAQKIALQGGYWIPVGAVNGLYVISPRVHGFVASNGWTWPVDNDWSKVSISSH